MIINKSYPCDARNYRRGRRDTIKYIVIHYVGAGGSALDNVKYYGSSNVGRKRALLRGPRKRRWCGVSKRRPERLCVALRTRPGRQVLPPGVPQRQRDWN